MSISVWCLMALLALEFHHWWWAMKSPARIVRSGSWRFCRILSTVYGSVLSYRGVSLYMLSNVSGSIVVVVILIACMSSSIHIFGCKVAWILGLVFVTNVSVRGQWVVGEINMSKEGCEIEKKPWPSGLVPIQGSWSMMMSALFSARWRQVCM